MHIEETLIQAFSQNDFAVVDGHDVGQGKFNIYVVPKAGWGPVIERAIAFLKLRNALNEALVVKQLKSGKQVVVWPANFCGKFEL
jgi:hypothetical protein